MDKVDGPTTTVGSIHAETSVDTTTLEALRLRGRDGSQPLVDEYQPLACTRTVRGEERPHFLLVFVTQLSTISYSPLSPAR